MSIETTVSKKTVIQWLKAVPLEPDRPEFLGFNISSYI